MRNAQAASPVVHHNAAVERDAQQHLPLGGSGDGKQTIALAGRSTVGLRRVAARLHCNMARVQMLGSQAVKGTSGGRRGSRRRACRRCRRCCHWPGAGNAGGAQLDTPSWCAGECPSATWLRLVSCRRPAVGTRRGPAAVRCASCHGAAEAIATDVAITASPCKSILNPAFLAGELTWPTDTGRLAQSTRLFASATFRASPSNPL